MSSAALLTIIAIAELDAGIPKGLLQAVCTVESNLNPYALVESDGVSGRASIGPCQLQQRTAAQFQPGISREELLSPATNARIAGAYLAFQYSRYGSWDRAIVAYNRGSSSGEVTNSYHRKVTKEWKKYGRDQATQGRADSGHSRREDYAARSGQFLREDYAYAD